jgi:hypothetical protein
VVGGGPTGVEIAGQIGELARDTLRREFRSTDPTEARVLLVETLERVLTSFPPALSDKATRSLEHLGVTPMLGHTVVDIDHYSVTTEDPQKRRERIPARTVIWAAGVTASSLAHGLGEITGADVDRAGRISVAPDLTLPGHPEVFALGDMVRVLDEEGEPKDLLGLAPVAMQQGRYVAQVLRARQRGREHQPFRYRDKGNVATIGRSRAVADIKGLKVSGFPAWLLWLGIHIWYLTGFQNRILLVTRWSFSFFTRGRGGRVIENLGEPSEPADRAETGTRPARDSPRPLAVITGSEEALDDVPIPPPSDAQSPRPAPAGSAETHENSRGRTRPRGVATSASGSLAAPGELQHDIASQPSPPYGKDTFPRRQTSS